MSSEPRQDPGPTIGDGPAEGTQPAPRRRGIGVLAGRGAIRLYQLTLSPLVGRNCRYLPTCSHYADEAIARHGFWAGGWMTLARLCRCHPFGASGFDPVPGDADGSGGRWWRPWRYGRWTGRHIDPKTRLDR
ncbi:putative membrane protein insertion efficiency factor [Amorphus orientalis]|uniref:Putative membrane protein insertion efficiency factor n=1 Tax=Amorphus orientalis TaxID=649198 RepID=A0AAE3VPH6_9HYPH|nr:putative membrane protein insertion efficiency factor [Amorphus orientalis]